MAHIKVVRRSMGFDKWSALAIDGVRGCVIAEESPTEGWRCRLAQCLREGTYRYEGEARPISPGDTFGRPDGCAIFTGRARVPDAFAGRPVAFRWPVASQVMVTVNGRLQDGLDANRELIPLLDDASGGEELELRLDTYVRGKPDDERAEVRHLRGCIQEFRLPTLAVVDEEAYAAWLELELVHEAAFAEAVDEDVREFLVARLHEAVKLLPPFESPADEIRRTLPAVRRFLKERVYLGDRSPFGRAGRLAMVAHSHLDLAYFWRVHEGVQKNARTCLIQIRLMERYPELIYSHSQAWAYESLKERYPALYEEVARRVADGRWEVVGGLYVEPDCNLISAESLARQCLYAQRFFVREFGFTVDNCWLPDVFGNSAIMPQVLKGCGIDYFVSNKMSTWNDTNRFPHNNFVWRGLDGTEIAACVPPVHFITWNEPAQLVSSWKAFIDKDVCDETLHMYGYGDGGSGVTSEMLERARRLASLPGMPRTRFTTGREYLHRAFAGIPGTRCGRRASPDVPGESEAAAPADPARPASCPRKFARWDGELYLEMHRGTFTSKAALKRENRRAEFRAFETEALCALAKVLAGLEYPSAEIEAAWKKILVNQFHDILPGSNTAPVERDAMEAYAEAESALGSAASAAREALVRRGGAEGDGDGARGGLSVFNPFGFTRTGVAILPEDCDGDSGQEQAVAGPTPETRRVTLVRDCPGLSFADAVVGCRGGAELVAEPGRLETPGLVVELNDRGEITRLLDRRSGREVVEEGALGNEWQLFEDRPGTYNAWDILRTFEDHRHELPAAGSVEVVECGPVSAAVRVARRFGSSTAVQVVRVFVHAPRIDFETWVDWREREKLLKVAFPLAVRAAHYTTDTSAGGLERPNHRNTSWEEARFEVCCHKWVDVSEGLYGVALMNDCKYGCDVKGGVVRLSLLRGPVRPDPASDEGEHRFAYSLYLHGGDWRTGGVVEAAYDLNWPMRAFLAPGGPVGSEQAGVAISAPALHVQALKLAEDGTGDVVLRLVELYGSRGTARVELLPGRPWRSIRSCDLLERETGELARDGDAALVPYRPFGIVTLRLTPG